MATKIYVADAANYRSGQNIENHIKIRTRVYLVKKQLKGFQEFSIECAILKVFALK